jgi:hypothetical protein
MRQWFSVAEFSKPKRSSRIAELVTDCRASDLLYTIVVPLSELVDVDADKPRAVTMSVRTAHDRIAIAGYLSGADGLREAIASYPL